MDMVNIKINGMPLSVPKDSTILEAARYAGINIPTLCFLKDINEIGACRMCVVEVKGARSLVAACVYPVNEGMEVFTNTPKVQESRKLHAGAAALRARPQVPHLQAQRKLRAAVPLLGAWAWTTPSTLTVQNRKPRRMNPRSIWSATMESASSAAAAWPLAPTSMWLASRTERQRGSIPNWLVRRTSATRWPAGSWRQVHRELP